MKLLYIIGQVDYDTIHKALKTRFGKSADIGCIMWLDDFEGYLTQGHSYDRCIILNPKRTIQNYSIETLGNRIDNFKRVLTARKMEVGQDVIFCVSNEEEGEILVERTCDLQGTVLIPEVQTFKSSDLAALSIKEFSSLREKYKCHSLSSLKLQQNRDTVAQEQEEDTEELYELEDEEKFIGGINGLKDDTQEDCDTAFDTDMSEFFNGSLLEDFYTDEEQGVESAETGTGGFSDEGGTEFGTTGLEGIEGTQETLDGGFGEEDEESESGGFDSEGAGGGFEEENNNLLDTANSEMSEYDEESSTEEFNENNYGFGDSEESADGKSEFFGEDDFFSTGEQAEWVEGADEVAEPVIDEFEDEEEVKEERVQEEAKASKPSKKNVFGGMVFGKQRANIKATTTPVETSTAKSQVIDTAKTAVSAVSLFEETEAEGGVNISSKALKGNKISAKAKVKKKAQPINALSELLKGKSSKSMVLVYTGCDGTGKTLVSANTANLLCRLGHSVLVIDLDTTGKGQSYINANCFDLVHGADPSANKVVNALNGTETALYKNLDVVRPGYHILTSTIGSESKGISEQVRKRSYYSLLYTLRSEYDFIIVDVGVKDLAVSFREIADSADHIFTVVEATTHGLMDFLLSFTNIDDEITQSMLFKRSKILLNKEDSLKSFYGRKVEDTLSLLSGLDDMVKLVTGIVDSHNTFADMEVCSILQYNSEFEQFWGTAKFISDTEAGEQLFSELLQQCLS